MAGSGSVTVLSQSHPYDVRLRHIAGADVFEWSFPGTPKDLSPVCGQIDECVPR